MILHFNCSFAEFKRNKTTRTMSNVALFDVALVKRKQSNFQKRGLKPNSSVKCVNQKKHLNWLALDWFKINFPQKIKHPTKLGLPGVKRFHQGFSNTLRSQYNLSHTNISSNYGLTLGFQKKLSEIKMVKTIPRFTAVGKFKSNQISTKKMLRLVFSGLVHRDVTKSLKLFSVLCDRISRSMVKQPTTFSDASKIYNKTVSSLALNRHCNVFSRNLVQNDVSRYVKRHTKTLKRFTVLRSPFVYKKTREQFNLKSVALKVNLTLDKPQQVVLNQTLSNTKFSSEVKCVSQH